MKLISFILILLFYHQLLLAAEPVAVISKLRGKVKHKLVSENVYRDNAHLNTPVLSDSQIKTKKGAFSRVVYLDDGSAISIYQNTEVKVQGTINNRTIIKQVDLIKGIIRVNVTNQKSNEFILATPFSELKCKQCNFWAISDELKGDQFIQESGYAELFNASINTRVELISDSTIISKENIEFNLIKTPITDAKFLESLMLDADEKTFEYKKEQHPEQSVATITNIVVIKLKNAANIEREIVVTYTQ